MARCAVTRSVTATSSGQEKCCWVAWARGGPTNSHGSPYFSASLAKPASIGPVQVPDGSEVLPSGDDVALVHQRFGPAYRRESLGVLADPSPRAAPGT